VDATFYRASPLKYNGLKILAPKPSFVLDEIL
jgi:hypothetical protein